MDHMATTRLAAPWRVLGILARKIGLYRDRRLSLELSPSAKLHWTTADQYRSDLQAFAAEQQRRYRELTSALVERGLLTPSERDQCRLSLEILIDDLRFNRTTQIPILGVGDRIWKRPASSGIGVNLSQRLHPN
jgi:hypothetical protein